MWCVDAQDVKPFISKVSSRKKKANKNTIITEKKSVLKNEACEMYSTNNHGHRPKGCNHSNW